jgi:hypothetical protein
MGGAGAGPIHDTLIHGHGGKQMLAKAALLAIESFCTKFSFPAAGMPTHKQFKQPSPRLTKNVSTSKSL